MRWTLQPGDQRHAGRRIAKSAILKMCRRGSAWCGVRLKGFWLIKLLKGVDEPAYPSNTFGSPSSDFCMVFRCWFISGLFPFPIIHFGLWPDNLSRGLVKPCRWVWKAGCKGSFDVFCSYHSLHGWLCRAEILSCVHWKYLESAKPLANIWPVPARFLSDPAFRTWSFFGIYIDIQIRPPIYCDKNSQLFPFCKHSIALRIESGSIQKVKCQGEAVKQLGSRPSLPALLVFTKHPQATSTTAGCGSGALQGLWQ